jgi:hypothetical protein
MAVSSFTVCVGNESLGAALLRENKQQLYQPSKQVKH